MDFRYRESELDLNDALPGITEKAAISQLRSLKQQLLHQTVSHVLTSLHSGPMSFGWIFDKYGKKKFEGTCHQASLAFGAVLKLLSFGNVYVLDGYQVEEDMLKEGRFVPIQPEERFKELGYNPYCLVEFEIGSNRYLASPKNFKAEGGQLTSILRPECHAAFVGALKHPQDETKSGVYIERIETPEMKSANPKTDFRHLVVWRKQKADEEKPEFFATFERKRVLGQTLADVIATGMHRGMAL